MRRAGGRRCQDEIGRRASLRDPMRPERPSVTGEPSDRTESPPRLWRPPYKDLPGVSENYADGLGQTIFNGRTAQITFTVNRYAPPHRPRPLGGERVTAARLALDTDVVIDLFNELGRMLRTLEAQGLIRVKDRIAKRPI